MEASRKCPRSTCSSAYECIAMKPGMESQDQAPHNETAKNRRNRNLPLKYYAAPGVVFLESFLNDN